MNVTRLSAGLALVVFSGCVYITTTPSAPEPAAEAPRAAPPRATQPKAGGYDRCGASEELARGVCEVEICTATIYVGELWRSNSDCFIDEGVTRAAGRLEFPCQGGEATAVFGGVEFRGTVKDGVIDVTYRSDYDYEDGCTWSTTQHIYGPLRGGALDFVYGEVPDAGRSDCNEACSAHARVTLK